MIWVSNDRSMSKSEFAVAAFSRPFDFLGTTYMLNTKLSEKILKTSGANHVCQGCPDHLLIFQWHYIKEKYLEKLEMDY